VEVFQHTDDRAELKLTIRRLQREFKPIIGRYASKRARNEQRIGRLLSAHTTCRLQHRSLFAYLTDALTAHAHGDPVPMLT
jgi:hypothetical protein